MSFEEMFNKIIKKLMLSIIEYMQNKITIDELVNSCQTLIDFLKFYDSYIDL